MSSAAAGIDPALSTASRPPLIAYLAVALMFLGSGASGLIYEVIWTRQLTTFFGASLFAVASVLTCFMGGLALGSWLVGRRADRMRRPLFFYGVLEVGIALASLAFPYLLKLTEPLVGLIYVTGGEGTFYAFTMVRFVLVFLLLIVPTTMMGATLPALSRAFTRDSGTVGRSVGGLYALNTVGACVGVFSAGFFLLENLGLTGTKVFAVAINVIVGLLAMAVGWKYFVVEPETNDAPRASQSPATDYLGGSKSLERAILIGYLCSGFAALGLQLCWFRALVFTFEKLKNTTYAFSSMLLIFLIGLAVGSALMQAIVDRQRTPLRLYGLLMLGIGLSSSLSFFLINRPFEGFVELNGGELIWWAAVGNVLLKSALCIGLPTLLMGMAFPVVSKLVIPGPEGVAERVGRLYAMNTVGAIAGSFLTGFVLIPVLGIATSTALLAAVPLLVAASVFALDPQASPASRQRLGAVIAAVALLVALRVGWYGREVKFQRINESERIIYYREGATATVSVVEDKGGNRTIGVDDVDVAGTDPILQTDQKTLAHVPMMLLGGEATRILTVGFGSGGASWSYTRYPDIQEIHAIEISPEVPSAAPYLTDANHGILYPEWMVADARAAGAKAIEGARYPLDAYVHEAMPGYLTFDPRYRVLIDDARAYLRFTELEYDVIATDCTDLRYKSNANLYDLEYFTLCRDRLSDRGLVIVWMPLGGLRLDTFKTALRTFQRVFPEMSVWYYPNYPTHYCLLIGGKGPLKIDYEAVKRAVGEPAINEDLAKIGLMDVDKMISCFVADERTLVEVLGDGPINSEDTPVIEFQSPRYGYDSTPIAINQGAIFARQVSPWPLIVNAPGDATRERIERLQRANAVLFEGHVKYREHLFLEANELYLQAQAIAPDDESIARLLDFPEVTAILENSPRTDGNVLWLGHVLAQAYIRQGRFSDAVTWVEPLVQRLPSPGPNVEEQVREVAAALNLAIAQAYLGAGVTNRARAAFERAGAYRPDSIRGGFDAFVAETRAKQGG